MIRIALLSLGFVGVTVALIMVQPTSRLRHAAPAPDPVTRNATDAALGQAARKVDAPTPRSSASPAALATRGARAERPGAADRDRPLAAPPLDDTLAAMVTSALEQGQSDAYIDALVNDAAERGAIAVPGRIITQEGRVDTPMVIALLGGQSTARAPVEPGFYEVRPGDTLASIAYRYYGKTSLATEILAANQQTLAANPVLMIGQRLSIPPRS